MNKTVTCVLALAAMFTASTLSYAQNEESPIYEEQDYSEKMMLPLLDAGPWPCAYYFLNSNDELSTVKPADWTGRCICEDDWIQGYGPLSNSSDQFAVTPWGSDHMPILVRRHFTLTAEEVTQLKKLPIHLLCSYDENPKVYLNGTLIWSKTGYNDNEYASYALTPRNKLLLKEGDNILAVSLTAGNGGGHIDYGLTNTGTLTPTAITQVNQDMQSANPSKVYNLNGQLMDNTRLTHSKGIYIQNAKKIIIK